MKKPISLFGSSLQPGNVIRRHANVSLDVRVDELPNGHIVKGTFRGTPGRIEVLRCPRPDVFLLNNWQSWGPMQRASSHESFPELEEIFRNYSPYVFSPIPGAWRRAPVSDYFIAWNETVLGFLASRIAHPFFTIEGDDLVGYLETFDVSFPDAMPLEPFVVLEGRDVEILLEQYGRLIQKENRVSINTWNPIGWCSWYHYFGKLAWRDVLENVEIAYENKGSFPFEVFQIDDGYQTEIGDWLTPKPGFPDIGGLARAVTERGFRAGIWTAPTSASETSDIYRTHPEWMVTAEGNPKVCFRGWGKSVFAIDTTDTRAKEWLFEIFANLKKAGFTYFKIDFLFAGAMPGVRRKNVTPIQAYREGLAVIRRAVGRSFVLGCGAPLLPSVGFVDGMRIGEDTAPYWKRKSSGFQGPNAYFAIKNALLRQFMHRKLWLNDPDCLLLRNRKIELSAVERELYALAAGSLDNMLIASDALSLVNGQGRDLFRRALKLRGGRSRVAGLWNDDIYRIHSRGGPAGDFVLGVNLSDAERECQRNRLRPRSIRFLTE